MVCLPRLGRRARLLPLIYGLAAFLWLRLEDNSVLPAVLVGLGGALVTGGFWVARRAGGKAFPLPYALIGAALFGALIGLATAPATAAAMLVKNGLHGHLSPDYPFGLIAAILARAPAWALAGALAGLGVMLAWAALARSEGDK
jgi:hypothetical protein